LGCATVAAAAGWPGLAHGATGAAAPATPIEHLVVIYDENVSFDHYFGTYPDAANPAGEPAFTAPPGPPVVDGLQGLRAGNPNGVDPRRIDRADALTCDQDHNYADEQKAFDGGAMDMFPRFASGGCGHVMDYFDGNTVTALWNLAAHFTLSDRFYGSTFGPSTPGALNLISGQTHGAGPAQGGIENGTMIGDPDPALDDCGSGSATMSGRNIGDALNDAGVTWGWFQGGFRRTAVVAGRAVCGSAHSNVGGRPVTDYSAHHEPFMYYASTANPHHLPPSSVATIGRTDQANHQYDLADFDNAVRAGNLPQVSFLKAASFEDGHAGYSDPLDEQRFLARTLDELEQSPQWASTAVVITYDDSDGWYDHSFAGIRQHSDGASDAAPMCNNGPLAAGVYKDRCGPGPRLPLLLVSPYAHVNTVASTRIEQASIIRFVEDNWLHRARLGDQSFDARAGSLRGLFDFAARKRARRLYLDPGTGEPLAAPPAGVVSSPNGPDARRVKPNIKPRLSVSAKRSGRTLRLTLGVSNLNVSDGRITVTARLRRKSRTLARSPRRTVRSGRVTVLLKAETPLQPGRYTLTVRVAQGAASATVTRRLRLR
jgi:phospholipase C